MRTVKNMFYLPILVDTALGEQMKKALLGGEAKELVDPYFLFSFAGKEVSVMKFRFKTFNAEYFSFDHSTENKKRGPSL